MRSPYQIKYVLTIVLLSSFICTQCQESNETVRVKKKYDNPSYTEIYYALASNKLIKHGKYQKLGYKKCILEEGYYKFDKKDSLWTTHPWRSENILTKGQYSEGIKIDVWEYYEYNGFLEQKYDHSKEELIWLSEDYFNVTAKIKVDTVFKEVKLDRIPCIVGASRTIEEVYNYYFDIYKYINNPVTGDVIVEFIVDSTGKASDFKIIKGLYPNIDSEVLRIAKLLPNDWIPAEYNGKLVTSKARIKRTFSYEER